MKHTHLKPICSKCGYDQSGEIATWHERCPMRGVCPECGLEFEWAGVLDPRLTGMAWSVEHARGMEQMVRRTLPTIWMLLIPNRYWARVRLDSVRSMPRFVGWLAGLLLALYLLAAGGNVAVRYAYARWDNAQLAKIKIGQNAQMQAAIDGMMTDTTALDFWGPVLGESLLFPFRTNRFFSYELVDIAGMGAALSVGLSLMWFLLMSAFPVTRRRAKLRVVHVARAMLVCGLTPLLLVPLAMIAEVIAFVTSLSSSSPVLGSQTPVWAGVWVVLGISVWVQWFWIVAVWRGWQIRARWYEMVLVVIASFFGLVFTGVLMLGFEQLRLLIEILADRVGV